MTLAPPRQIWGLICLALFARGENNFIFPPNAGPAGIIVDDADSNLEFAIGDTIHLRWTTNSTTPITLIAFQGPRDVEMGFNNATLLDRAPVPVPLSFDWKINSLDPSDPNYATAPIHFLLWNGFEETSFNSKYVRITSPGSGSTSTSSGTSSGSSQGSSPTSTPSQSSPSPSASSGGGDEALKIGLGVGISLAFVLGGLLGYLLFRRRASRRNASSTATSDAKLAKGETETANVGAPVTDMHEVGGKEARPRRHEASGTEVYEAP